MISSPTFFSASLSVNVNLVHALCPWYIRISISIWLQAGGPLCIPVTVVSTTHRADINREDSPLWLYHFCPAHLNGARISASAKKTLPGERKMWCHSVLAVLPLITNTLVLRHTHFSLLSYSSSHSACPCGRGFTRVLSGARSYGAVPSVILLLIKAPIQSYDRGWRALFLQWILAKPGHVMCAHKANVFNFITKYF